MIIRRVIVTSYVIIVKRYDKLFYMLPKYDSERPGVWCEPRPCPKPTTLLQLLSGRTSPSAEMNTAGIVDSTPWLGKRFPIHIRTFMPLPDLFPVRLDLPALQRPFRSPSCAAKPGTVCVLKRPRHPGRGTRGVAMPFRHCRSCCFKLLMCSITLRQNLYISVYTVPENQARYPLWEHLDLRIPQQSPILYHYVAPKFYRF